MWNFETWFLSVDTNKSRKATSSLKTVPKPISGVISNLINVQRVEATRDKKKQNPKQTV